MLLHNSRIGINEQEEILKKRLSTAPTPEIQRPTRHPSPFHLMWMRKRQEKEIEDTGIWFDFDGEEDESFVTYDLEMHLFIREGSKTPEGIHTLMVNQLTTAHFGNVDHAAMVKLIESLELGKIKKSSSYTATRPSPSAA